VRRGEVRWYRFARPDKRRPVVVLTRSNVIDHLSEVTVAPLTTTLREIPTQVALDESDGVLRSSAVSLDHLQTVSKGRLGPLIVTLPRARMRAVSRALAFALGFDEDLA
jgi:mRNA interferase MazF